MTVILWLLAAALVAASLLAGWAARRRVMAVSRWPTCQGRVVDSGVRSNGNGTWSPEVSYAYVVGGRGFAGDRLRPGGTPFFYAEGKALALAAAYDRGSPVTVHHHPRKPSRAAIELVPFSHLVTLLRVMAALMLFVAALVSLGA